MKITTAKLKHKQQIKNLWNYCFYDSDPYLSWYFDNVFKPENTVVALEGDTVLAALQLLDFDVAIRNKIFPCSYIAGVSTLPEMRGKGLARQIMSFGEELAKSRGKEFALLTPSVDGFYEKFGYTSCYDRLDYSYCPTDYMPRKTGFVSKRAGREDVGDMQQIYEKFVSEYDGYVERKEKDFVEILDQYGLETGGTYIFYDKNDEPAAYIVYDIENRNIYADEIAYTGEAGLHAVLEFIFAHNSQIDRVVIHAPSHGLLAETLYSGQIEIKKVPTVMIKSLNEKIDDIRLFVGQRGNEKLPLQKNYIRIF